MKKTMFTILVLVISLLFVSTHLVERVSADSSSIQIDGNFNDWDNVPGTKLNSSQPADINGTQTDFQRDIKLSYDEHYIYVYIDSWYDLNADMSNHFSTLDKYANFHQQYYIFIDGKPYQIQLGNGSVTNGEGHAFSVDVSQAFGDWQHLVHDTQGGYVDVETVKGDESKFKYVYEFRISRKDLAVTIPENSEISLTSSGEYDDFEGKDGQYFKGKASITYVGASSGPWIIAFLGLLIAFFGYRLRLKRQTKEKNTGV
ncbi:Firmicu-CTERM sorting domain-containing protein [Leuconostoc falkenbergense]|jgi:uncharacterized protein (TIGR04145 family)|uniref:Firmicu-CTERM sorting domain-containing protein n=1 Tax=Leuconostoc falkenbergense TaxID=2766470 RepID=UPI001F54B9CB|nr:Firmicu-CTERM sorting domain-containing protein [Leuconostoc falkenbergense]MDV3544816.1 hypothetical protein [Leuconostoc falkenbergense]